MYRRRPLGVRSCDGSGTCATARDLAQDCGAYTCDGAACLSSCTTDASCADGFRCAASDGVCTDKSFVGETCGGDSQCYSGSCVDGVCCESACEGICEACSASKTGQADGSCAPIVAGVILTMNVRDRMLRPVVRLACVMARGLVPFIPHPQPA